MPICVTTAVVLSIFVLMFEWTLCYAPSININRDDRNIDLNACSARMWWSFDDKRTQPSLELNFLAVLFRDPQSVGLLAVDPWLSVRKQCPKGIWVIAEDGHCTAHVGYEVWRLLFRWRRKILPEEKLNKKLPPPLTQRCQGSTPRHATSSQVSHLEEMTSNYMHARKLQGKCIQCFRINTAAVLPPYSLIRVRVSRVRARVR